jgi:hypothetical protein
MTNFLAEQAEPIDPTPEEQGRSIRDRQRAGGPGLRPGRLTEVPGRSTTEPNPPCSAVLVLAGRQYQCDLPTDAHGRHDGWKHSNEAAEAIWCDDATSESGVKPVVPLTLKDIGDLDGALDWGDTRSGSAARSSRPARSCAVICLRLPTSSEQLLTQEC